MVRSLITTCENYYYLQRENTKSFYLLVVVPAFAEPDIHFAVSGPEGPSQKIGCVRSASPETVRREPQELDLRRSVGQWQDLSGPFNSGECITSMGARSDLCRQ